MAKSLFLLDPPWTPARIPGLKLWLDPLKSSPGLAIGDPVGAAGTAIDLSGNGNDITQATAAKRPTLQVGPNGKLVWRFDGVDDGLDRSAPVGFPTGSGARTVFVVLNYTGSAVGYPFATEASPIVNYKQFGFTYLGGGTPKTAVSFTGGQYGNASVASGFHIIEAVYPAGQTQASAVKLWRNGTSLAMSLLSGADGAVNSVNDVLGIGYDPVTPSGFFSGDIAEVIAYDSEVSAALRARLRSYLGSKYGIAVS